MRERRARPHKTLAASSAQVTMPLARAVYQMSLLSMQCTLAGLSERSLRVRRELPPIPPSLESPPESEAAHREFKADVVRMGDVDHLNAVDITDEGNLTHEAKSP